MTLLGTLDSNINQNIFNNNCSFRNRTDVSTGEALGKFSTVSLHHKIPRIYLTLQELMVYLDLQDPPVNCLTSQSAVKLSGCLGQLIYFQYDSLLVPESNMHIHQNIGYLVVG